MDGRQQCPDARPAGHAEHANAGWVHYQIKISVDDGYLFTIKQSAANASGKPLVVRPIGLVSRADKAHDPDSWTNHVGPMTVFGGTADYGINCKTLDEGSEGFSNVSGWLGFTDKYWLTALVPAGNVARTSGARRAADTRPTLPRRQSP